MCFRTYFPGLKFTMMSEVHSLVREMAAQTTQSNPQRRFFFPAPASAERRSLFFPAPASQKPSGEKTTAFLAEGLKRPQKLMKKLKALVLAQA